MKLTAINADTGKVLLSQSGSLTEDQFRKTVLGTFPEIDPERIIIITDGAIRNKIGRSSSVSPFDGKAVVWRGSFTDLGGYANMNREICLRLQHYGYQVKIEILRTGVQVDPMTHGMLRAMEGVRFQDEGRCPLIIGFTPMPVRAPGRRVIFYTMMETQGLHPEFAKRCNSSATEIWVPCRFYEEVFRKHGVAKPISILPLGVNEKIYTPDAKEPELVYEEFPSFERVHDLPKGFRFISIFGWSYRKGPDILCRSFLEEFDGDDDAYLVIYSRYMGSSADHHKDHVRREITEYYKEVNKENPPRIYYCGDAIPIGDFPGCYAAADAFVLCSRGEGFALPIMEAAACETPVISSYNTAMTDYLCDDVAYCVEPDDVAPANDKLCWISEYYRDQDFAVMGDVAVEKFRRAMRSAYTDPKEAQQKAQNFKMEVLRNYTWDLCAQRVVDKLKSERR